MSLHIKYFDVWLEQYLWRVENRDIQTYMHSSRVTRGWTEMEILQSDTTKSNPKWRKNRSQEFCANRPRCGLKLEFKRKSRGMKCGAEPEGNTKRMVHVCDSLTVNSDLLPGKSPSLTISWWYEEENEQARTCVTPLSTPLCNFPHCPLAMHTQTHAYTNSNTQLELQGDSCHFFR